MLRSFLLLFALRGNVVIVAPVVIGMFDEVVQAVVKVLVIVAVFWHCLR